MPSQTTIDLSQFPNSPCAAELRAGVSRLKFEPPLEAEYRQIHLQRALIRIRAWGALQACFAILFTIGKVSTQGPLHPISLLHYVVVATALATAWLPWSRFYYSHYLPIVRITIPLVALMTAPFSAQQFAGGHTEVVTMLALQVVGTFQFTGLLFRMALVAATGIVAGFYIGAILWNLPPDVAITYVAIMGLAALLASIESRGLETIARTQFLEARLLGELLERDPLTGLKNRRSFDDHLQRIWLQAQRDRRSVAVLMVDVDDFKRYNDTYGHQAGDEALRGISSALREFGRRPLDLVARYGGEEFALIMSDVKVDHASKVAEQLRARIAGLGIAHSAARAADHVTLSIGVAVVEPQLGRTPGGLVQLADEALYAAKAAGRNRVVVRGPEAYMDLDTGVFSVQAEQARSR